MFKIIYSDNWLAKKIRGKHAAVTLCLFWPLPVFILVSPNYKDDDGLLAHELEHYRQFKEEWFYSIKMLCCDQYRLEHEIECYRVQLKYSEDKEASADLFTFYICNNYNLTASQETVKKLLLL